MSGLRERIGQGLSLAPDYVEVSVPKEGWRGWVAMTFTYEGTLSGFGRWMRTRFEDLLAAGWSMRNWETAIGATCQSIETPTLGDKWTVHIKIHCKRLEQSLDEDQTWKRVCEAFSHAMR